MILLRHKYMYSSIKNLCNNILVIINYSEFITAANYLDIYKVSSNKYNTFRRQIKLVKLKNPFRFFFRFRNN